MKLKEYLESYDEPLNEGLVPIQMNGNWMPVEDIPAEVIKLDRRIRSNKAKIKELRKSKTPDSIKAIKKLEEEIFMLEKKVDDLMGVYGIKK